MNINEMNLEQLDERVAKIRAAIDSEDADLDELSDELDQIEARRSALKANVEKRNKIAQRVVNGTGSVLDKATPSATPEEIRANEFVKTGRTKRTLLATGTIATPTKVGSISNLATTGFGIVDDVNAFSLTGNGAWTRPYKKKEAKAVDATDGEKLGGTGSEYGTVTVNPGEWAVVDEISNQVKKMTPVNYESAVVNSALIALMEKASNKILTAVKASALVEKKTNVKLDADYLSGTILGFRPVKGNGPCVLYINGNDLSALGKIRGTQDKKAVYTIEYTDEERLTGFITEGATSTKFKIIDELEDGTQLYGQPRSIDMPMWDEYKIETNDSEKFSENKIVIRGVQTAGADLVVYHGMQIIKQGE